jgi:transcriptional regulator with PAS, ATPase and Fis domain
MWMKWAIVIGKTIENKKLRNEVDYYRKICSPLFEKELIGETAPMKELREKIWKVAEAGVGVLLITGENGTGKEVAARNFHRLRHGGCSSRYAPFVAVNCAAIPEAILESELFGYEEGSFTGARTDKSGLFEEARGGSILLDEIGEMKLELQSKLLRVLEERRIRRIGGKENIPFEATVIATTNRNLAEAVAKGEFRTDLYYRLNGFVVHTLPLREIREDISVLADHFLKVFSKKYNRRPKRISPEALAIMEAHDWPGNIRELKNMMERIVVLEPDEVINPENLPFGLNTFPPEAILDQGEEYYFTMPDQGISLEGLERNLIRQAMEKTGYNKAQAAKLLNISYNAIRWQVKKFGLE